MVPLINEQGKEVPASGQAQSCHQRLQLRLTPWLGGGHSSDNPNSRNNFGQCLR